MVSVRTNLATLPNARLDPSESTPTMPANNVQEALNNLDSRVVTATPGSMRKPAAAASITGLASDVEVGITTTVATTYTLPVVANWIVANTSGVPLTIKDISGSASTNNITVVPNGSDTIVDGTTVVNSNFGDVQLRPASNTSWYRVQ